MHDEWFYFYSAVKYSRTKEHRSYKQALGVLEVLAVKRNLLPILHMSGEKNQ
jgi:hypothetical protein